MKTPPAAFPPIGWFLLCLSAGVGLEGWLRFRLGPWLGRTRVPLALALFVAAAGMGVWTLALFAKHRTTPMPSGRPSVLLTWGPFRCSRNPLYLAGVVSHVALGLLVDSGWTVLGAVLLFVALDRWVISREEARLRATFGATYVAYAARVRRWV